ncbi:hypothetical protein B0H13DRAFT_1910283 [Mycena leptocephala]|nr:hypothetical protein B0H13DRAFT_1910283 [Mycena leptocephala]
MPHQMADLMLKRMDIWCQARENADRMGFEASSVGLWSSGTGRAGSRLPAHITEPSIDLVRESLPWPGTVTAGRINSISGSAHSLNTASMHVIKYFCYEDSFLARLFRIRTQELRGIRKLQHSQSANNTSLTAHTAPFDGPIAPELAASQSPSNSIASPPPRPHRASMGIKVKQYLPPADKLQGASSKSRLFLSDVKKQKVMKV